MDADALEIRGLTRALQIDRVHPPKTFHIPSLRVLQYAINQPNSFPCMEGVKLGHTYLGECLVTSATHSPVTVLVISGVSKMKRFNAHFTVLHQMYQKTTREDLARH